MLLFIFFKIPFASSGFWSEKILMDFAQLYLGPGPNKERRARVGRVKFYKKNIYIYFFSTQTTKGRGRATPIFWAKIKVVCIEYGVAYELWPENIFENFPGMLGLPEGRGRTTHFWQKKLHLGYFSKLCLHRVAYELERLFYNFSDIFVQPEVRFHIKNCIR